MHNAGVEVQYKKIIEKPDYFKNRVGDYLNYQISTKGKDWEYEQEWRLYIIDPSPMYMALPYKPKRGYLRIYESLLTFSKDAEAYVDFVSKSGILTDIKKYIRVDKLDS